VDHLTQVCILYSKKWKSATFLNFWYVKKPDSSRFILDSWAREFVRDAETGILYLKRHETSQITPPEKFSLSQNYPNPFNAETQIYFSVKDYSSVNLSVNNNLGQKVKTLMEGKYQPGEYRALWDGKTKMVKMWQVVFTFTLLKKETIKRPGRWFLLSN
jgi:hypothetical protein